VQRSTGDLCDLRRSLSTAARILGAAAREYLPGMRRTAFVLAVKFKQLKENDDDKF
jgi:hypothetical protein